MYQHLLKFTTNGTTLILIFVNYPFLDNSGPRATFYGVYVFGSFILVEHLVKSATLILIMAIRLELLNFISRVTVAKNYVKYFLSVIAIILN